LMESTTVGTTFRHDAVSPHYVGDESTLPNPLPTPEEDPNFTEWGDPTGSYLLLPRENAKQNFRCTSVGFMESNPRIFGVTADVIADIPSHMTSRSVLIPIKTVGGSTHTEFPISSDMLGYQPSLRQLIMENPKANDPVIDESDINWSANVIDNSEYGFRIEPVVQQGDFEKDWNPALLRYPVLHDQTVDDGLGIEDLPSRHWEEFMTEQFTIEPDSRWDWACPVYEDIDFFDTPGRFRVSYCEAWSNTRMADELIVPEEFMKGAFAFGDELQVDTVILLEETFSSYDTSYHEHVEELRSWLDPYDAAFRDWGVGVQDGFNVEITDIFDNHFFTEDSIDATVQARSNHEFIGETLYPDDESRQGIILYADDGFSLEEDHFDGNWVEQVEEAFNISPDILTRHWRFEMFFFVCVHWWEIGVVEQPIEGSEINPCQVRNDSIGTAYVEFFGLDGYYDEIKKEYRDAWLLAGGDPLQCAVLQRSVARQQHEEVQVPSRYGGAQQKGTSLAARPLGGGCCPRYTRCTR
jgi:hypothetical protein